jgi:hypothetical protein
MERRLNIIKRLKSTQEPIKTEKKFRGEIHAIYWKMHTSYLKNNRDTAKLFFGMLSSYSDYEILNEIGLVHYNRFEIIRKNIENNMFGRLNGNGYTTPDDITTYKKEKTIKEKDFCKLLYSKTGSRFLAELVGADLNSYTILNEFELGDYGRLDFLIKSGRKVYAIEVKTGEAPSSLVSQIDKYRLALELSMNFGLYDEVQAFVVAEAFPVYVTGELSRLSIELIEHKGTLETLKLVS